MVFHQENIAFNIIDVLEIRQKNVKIENRLGQYHALSFRRSADTFITCGDDKLHLTGGSISYFPAGVSYLRESKEDNMIVIHMELFNYRSDKIQTVCTKCPDDYLLLFERVLNIWQRKEKGYRFECMEVLARIFRLLQIETEPEEKIPTQILRSVSYMLKEFKDCTLTVERLAQMSYISEAYFRKLFKLHYGISPKQYLTQLRIEYANYLLKTKYYTIAEVAEMSGFSNQKYFASVYKKTNGFPPSKYAEQKD